MLEVRDLEVWYDLPGGGRLHAVRGVSLDLDPGQRMGLVGESGCGKTTALMALMALLPSSATISGDVYLDGESILAAGEATARRHRQRDVAMIFQGAMNAFNPVRTIGAQIIEPMRVHRVAEGAAARRRTAELLEIVGIPGSAAARYPHELSGGMRQRAMIALALACRPRVLLADEPTTALDVMVQAQVLERLVALTDELDLALLLVTHDLAVVSQVCDRAAVMYAGRIVETGPVEHLYHDPMHPYTRLLFGATPDLDDETDPVSIPGAPPQLDRPVEGCSFAPRCDRTMEVCLATEPPVTELQGRRAECHLLGPDAGRGDSEA